MFKSLNQIQNHLQRQDKNRKDHYTLGRMQQAVERLDHPELQYRVVHVTGTSGKGSTCHMIQSILQAAGYRVGLYTSPVLVTPLERITINNRSITEPSMVRLINVIWPNIADLRLTSFELFTLLALYYFAGKQVDYAVVEVGMGGLYDATNVVQADLAIITSVGLDHTDSLGKTKHAIARHKAGIIKPNSIALTGSRLIKKAKFIDTHKYSVQHRSHQGSVFHYQSLKNIHLALLGDFQIQNAVLAIEAARVLHISQPAIRKGLEKVHHRYRFMICSSRPYIIADGAHNPDKMTAFANSLFKYIVKPTNAKVIALVSVKYNKDINQTLKPLLSLVDELIITSFDISAPVEKIRTVAKQLSPNLPCTVQVNPHQAYRLFRRKLQTNDIGIITGSLYLLGELEAKNMI